MTVIFKRNNFILFTHNRQENLFEESDGSFLIYRLKENLFENFRRKQKSKEIVDPESEISEFLKMCKVKCLFPLIEEDMKEIMITENLGLMNQLHNISQDFEYFRGENNLSHGKITTMNEHVYLIPPNSKFYSKRIEDIESCIEPNEANKFDFIVVDPPWKNRYIKRVKKKSVSKGYFMMSDDEIAEIPLEKYVKSSSIVIIWCTNSESHIQAIKEKLLLKWKLKLLSTWQWMKIDKNGELFCPLNGNKKPFERIFIATHQDNTSYDNELENDLVIFSQPSSIHSHKPQLIDIFNKHLPPNPKCLEIFARSLYENFTSIGLEVLKLQNSILFEKV